MAPSDDYTRSDAEHIWQPPAATRNGPRSHLISPDDGGVDDAPPAAHPSRRRALGIGFGALAVPVIGAAGYESVRAADQGTSVRSNLTLIAPAAAGGGWDTFQREMQEAMRANRLVGNVQVLNIPGAGGTIAVGSMKKRTTPSYLMVGGTGQIAATAQFGTPSRITDLTPVARVVEELFLVNVPADSPHKDLDSLVRAWRKDPKKIAWTGGGSSDQMVITELALAAGIDPADITYIPSSGGGEAIQAMLNGTAQASSGGFPDIYPQVQSGRLRGLGVASKKRLKGVDIPTMPEQGYDVTLTNWRAQFAPPGASKEDVAELVRLMEETTATAEWKDAVERNYWVEVPLSGQAFDEFIRAEIDKIGSLIEEMGV